jgi:predicted HD superfamily hydrolase involved in NAD metabolism
MKFTENQIEALRLEVGNRLSARRFAHTLGVEKMAVLIGKKIIPESVDKLRVAALLHDISKEYSEAEYIEIIKKHNLSFSDEDKKTSALWHSITAPYVVLSEFPEFADDDVLSAVYNHTVGAPGMSVFDEIILLSDYIEEGRSYKNCIDLREKFFSEFMENNNEDCVAALHRAVVTSLDNNINEFISRGQSFHGRTKATRDAILEKLER